SIWCSMFDVPGGELAADLFEGGVQLDGTRRIEIVHHCGGARFQTIFDVFVGDAEGDGVN
ncbi:MAG: hypothetical protein ABL898_08270, partial [Hyphomicrobiaceae bacterium]